MKLVISIVMLSSAFLVAKPYAGGQFGWAHINSNPKIKGQDLIDGTLQQYSYTPGTFSYSSFSFGVLGGYTFKANNVLVSFIEVDTNIHGKAKNCQNVDVDVRGNNLTRENLKVQLRYTLGLMPGLDIKLTENISAIFGVRLSASNYSITASHTSTNGGNDPQNYMEKKVFIFAVEPTVGTSYKITGNASVRFTAGYILSFNKKVIGNYVNSDVARANNLTAGVSIRPRGFNVRAAFIVGF